MLYYIIFIIRYDPEFLFYDLIPESIFDKEKKIYIVESNSHVSVLIYL